LNYSTKSITDDYEVSHSNFQFDSMNLSRIINLSEESGNLFKFIGGENGRKKQAKYVTTELGKFEKAWKKIYSEYFENSMDLDELERMMVEKKIAPISVFQPLLFFFVNVC